MPGNLVGHGGPVKALAVDAASDLVLSGSFDYAMMVWDVSGDEPRRVHRFDAHEGAVNAVAFVPDAGGGRPRRAIAAGDDGSVWLWDIETGNLVHRFRGHEGKVNAVAVSPQRALRRDRELGPQRTRVGPGGAQARRRPRWTRRVRSTQSRSLPRATASTRVATTA